MTQSAAQHMKNRGLNSEAYNELWEGAQSGSAREQNSGVGTWALFNVNPRLIVYEGV